MVPIVIFNIVKHFCFTPVCVPGFPFMAFLLFLFIYLIIPRLVN